MTTTTPIPVLRRWPAAVIQDAIDRALPSIDPDARPWYWRECWETVLTQSHQIGDLCALSELHRLALEAHRTRGGAPRVSHLRSFYVSPLY